MINYYGKRPRRKDLFLWSSARRLINNLVHNAKEDYISQLPDAVLSSILANLTVTDAVRTRILSRSWKRLFSAMPALNFSCLDMYGVYCDDHEW